MRILSEAEMNTSPVRSEAPARTISPELRAWAMQRFAPKLRWWVLAIVGGANMLRGVMFIAMHFATGGVVARFAA